MDLEMARLVKENTPKLNPILADGLAIVHVNGFPGDAVRQAEKYVDDTLRSAMRGAPKDFVYVGCRRCTPQEQFAIEVAKNNKKTAKRQYDTARSDLYLMRYMFTYKGEPIERYLYLPVVSEAATIWLSGSRFTISPILSDRVISILSDSIFIRLLRDRLTLERIPHKFMIDGRCEDIRVVWSAIYHKPPKEKGDQTPTVKAHSTLMHYLLCKYGFKETFRRFGGCDVIVGESEINNITYPQEDWVICTASGARPRSMKKGYWEAPRIHLAIARHKFTPMVKEMVGAFFYIVDHFPDRVQSQYIGDAAEKYVWMILLGKINEAPNINEGILYNKMCNHLESLDEYLDTLIVDKLREINLPVNDIYELLARVMENMNEWVANADDQIASMYNKELNILYYLLFSITSGIFKLYFKLVAATKKEVGGQPKELTYKEVTSIVSQTMKMGAIFSITKSNGGVRSLSAPGDNKAFKLTNMLVPQSSSSGRGRKNEHGAMKDPSKRLHASIAEIGSYPNPPKSGPDGRERLNLTAKIDEKGVVVPDPRHAPLLNAAQELFRR